MAKQPFVVPGADGRRRQLSEKGAAGVEAPDDMQLPDVEAIGAVLWSSPTDVRGVDLGNATLGSPTLAFALEADGVELEVRVRVRGSVSVRGRGRGGGRGGVGVGVRVGYGKG